MPMQNHPDDEALARFADADPEALGDSGISGHLDACDRCRTVVDDLRSLRLALSAMPDPAVAPPRPLRFLPPVEPRPATFADRVGAVIRGAFAPVVTAGAALALVGAVGTADIATNFAPASGPAPGPAAPQAEEETQASEEGFTAAELTTPTPAAVPAERDAPAGAEGAATDSAAATEEPVSPVYQSAPDSADEEPAPELLAATADPSATSAASAVDVLEPDAELAAERRPIWPMLLFSGVALMVAAVVLRWIFQPRPA
jgi:hypothetical protein